MKTYTFMYTETDTYRAYFEAEDLEAATKLLDQVESGEWSISDLPNFGANGKEYSYERQTGIEEVN